MALRFWTDYGDYKTRPWIEEESRPCDLHTSLEEGVLVAMNFRSIYLMKMGEEVEIKLQISAR